MDDLERELIEISTKLRDLGPEIKAAAELRINVASLQKELEMFRQTHDKSMDGVNERLNDGSDLLKQLELRIQSCEDKAEALTHSLDEKTGQLTKGLEEKVKTLSESTEQKLAALQKADASMGDKAWAIIKMFISALIGGGAAYLLGHSGGISP